MDMLEALIQVEAVLSSLLRDEAEWKDVDVDYHPPRVEILTFFRNQYGVV